MQSQENLPGGIAAKVLAPLDTRVGSLRFDKVCSGSVKSDMI